MSDPFQIKDLKTRYSPFYLSSKSHNLVDAVKEMRLCKTGAPKIKDLPFSIDRDRFYTGSPEKIFLQRNLFRNF